LLSLLLGGMGRFDEAHDMAQKAVPVDPLSPMDGRWMAGPWAPAAATRRPKPRCAARSSSSRRMVLALWNMGISLVGLKRYDEAVAVLHRAHAGEPVGASLVLGMLAWTEAAAGRHDKGAWPPRRAARLDAIPLRPAFRVGVDTRRARRHRCGARRVRALGRGA
jgi:hypothetical protein